MSEERELEEMDLTVDDAVEDISSFVDFADLAELEQASNEELFGELGDIGDLGDISFEMPQEETPPIPVEEAEAEQPPVPDIALEEGGEMPLPDIALEESDEMPLPDIALEESDETPLPDIALEESDEMPLPDIALEENDEMPLPDIALEESDEPLALDMETESASAEGGEDSLLDALDVLGGGADDDGGSMDDMLAALDDSFAEAAQEDAISDADIGDIDLNALDALTEDGAEEGAADNIDSMLDGLLDNLDMNGSIEEPDTADADTADAKTEEEDGMLDFLGLDDMSENAEEETEELLNVADMIPDAEAPEEEKKPGFFKRVFGNVVTDEIAEQERLAAQQEEEELARKAEEDAKAKEEKAAAQEEKKAQKAAAKEEKKKQKEAQKAEKAQKKAEKKAQREEEEAAELEVVGKLNKVGVSIIAIATILFLTVEIAGTNTFGYVSSKNKALDYFDMGKYTEAYAEAIGTNMRDKDAEEYNKIKVVMKVQQSLNAYQNYDRVNYYPEALDALLRGLKRYDANIDEAIELEVDGDMMSCRKQILTLLKEEFNLSEAQAYSILALDKEAYQSKVVALGLKKK